MLHKPHFISINTLRLKAKSARKISRVSMDDGALWRMPRILNIKTDILLRSV